MKKLVLTGIATLAFALGALAQGSIDLDNSLPGNNYGLATDTAGNYVAAGATFGLEVWELSGVASVPAGIDVAPGGGSGLAAYAAMKGTAGFTKEATYANQTTPAVGTITLGEVDMADVTPAGSQVVLGLAAWNNSAASWSAGVAQAGAKAGVIAFLQSTANYKSTPAPTPIATTAGWNAAPAPGDLVMTSVPEPGVFALAGLGAAALLIFRRRK